MFAQTECPALDPRRIHLWLLTRPSACPAAWLVLTTPEEQRHAAGFASVRRRTEWLTGRALQRYCLARHTGIAPLALPFSKTSQGKPLLDLPDAPHFNLSHGPDWLGCAVSHHGAIGLDIDSSARRNRIDDIAERYFHPQEQAALQRCQDDNSRRALFFRLWTLKEAWIKAHGETINSVRLRDIAFACEGDTCTALFPASGWQLHQQTLGDDTHLAVVARQTTALALQQHWLDADNPPPALDALTVS